MSAKSEQLRHDLLAFRKIDPPPSIASVTIHVPACKARFRLEDAYCAEPRCRGDRGAIELHAESAPGRSLFARVDFTARTVRGRDLAKPDERLLEELHGDDAFWRLLLRRHHIVRAYALTRLPGTAVDLKDVSHVGFVDSTPPRSDGDLAIPFDSSGDLWWAHDLHPRAGFADLNKVRLDLLSADNGGFFRVALRFDREDGDPRGLDRPLSIDDLLVLRDLRREIRTWREELSVRGRLLREILDGGRQRAPKARRSRGR